jgi:osmotically-inducible protein OsmY
MKNRDLQYSVQEELKKDNRLQGEEIEAVVVDHTVTLKGTVSSSDIAHLAENIAYDIEGIDSVENYLLPKETGTHILNEDEIIKNRLINLFSLNHQLRFPCLKIQVSDGIVTISGTVDEIWKKSLIQELALDTSGVKKVENNIEVAPSQKESDENLAIKIKNTMDKNYMIDSDRVQISVRKGIVRLSGEVRSQLALRAAINSAVYTPGVMEINNELRVAVN